MSHLGVAAGGRCSHRASPKPSASVLLTQAPPVKLDHVYSFNEKPALVCGLTFEWHATVHVHAGGSQVKSLHALSGVQVPLIYPCVSRCVCVCVCHVFGIVMSFHMSPCHQFRFPSGVGGGGLGVMCRGGGDPSQHWQRCI